MSKVVTDLWGTIVDQIRTMKQLGWGGSTRELVEKYVGLENTYGRINRETL